jgi:FixJ family two-component response regulator
MSKQDLLNTIGKVFVDKEFRQEFSSNTDQTLDSIAGLTNKEKQILKDMKNDIDLWANKLDIHYTGENKGSR